MSCWNRWDLDLTTDSKYQETKAEKLSKDKHFFEDSENHEKIVKVLSSGIQNGPWVVGEKISVTCILSDFKLDFTDAIFNFPVVHMKMFGLFSSNTIYVPEGVRVVCKNSSYLSSVNSRVFGNADENAQTIVIHGTSILSSVDIKIRVTMKEKWLDFAGGVKDLFN